MVQFAQPLALWLLVLAPLPLVLSRRWRPRRRLEVANLYLWTEARQHEREGPSVRKVRRRWSAVLQAAVLALVAVALARPAMTWTAPPIAVVIDVSASMGARADGATRLALASQVAQRELEAMPSSTHVSIIAAADAPRAVGVFSAGDPKARLAVGELETTSGGADLQSALDLAASSGASRAIVITDRQVPAARAVRVLKVGQPTDNVAVTNVVASVRELGRADGDVVAQVRNFGAQARDVTVEVTSDGQVVHRARLMLLPRGDELIRVHVNNLGAVVSARVIEDDALGIDNARVAAVAGTAAPTRVAYAGPATGALHAALVALPSIVLVPVPVTAGAPSCVNEDRLAGARLLVIDGCQPVSPSLPALVVGPQGRAVARGDVTVADASHPVAAALMFDETTVVGSPVDPDVGDVPILRGDDRPVVVASERAGRRRVTASIDVDRSPFVLTAGFPVLVANAVEWLAAAGADTSSLPIGSEPARIDVGESDLVTTPPDVTPLTLVAGAAADHDVTGWVLLAGVALLAAEWHLRARGM